MARSENRDFVGVFGPEGSIPLITDIVPSRVLESVIKDASESNFRTGGLVQNDGKIIPDPSGELSTIVCQFCMLVRQSEIGNHRCNASDRFGVMQLLSRDQHRNKQDDPLIQSVERKCPEVVAYYCHAMNLELIAPILLTVRDENGHAKPRVVAAIWSGQMKHHRLTEKIAHELQTVASAIDVPPQKLLDTYKDRKTVYTEDAVRTALHLRETADAVSTLVSHLYENTQSERSSRISKQLVVDLSGLLDRRGLDTIEKRFSTGLELFTKEFDLSFSLIGQLGHSTDGDDEFTFIPFASSKRSAFEKPVRLKKEAVEWFRDNANARPTRIPPSIIAKDACDKIKRYLGVKEEVRYMVKYFNVGGTNDLGQKKFIWVTAESCNKSWYMTDNFAMFSLERVITDVSTSFRSFLSELASYRELSEMIERQKKTERDLFHAQKMTKNLVIRMAHLVTRPLSQMNMGMSALLNNPLNNRARTRFRVCLFELERAAMAFKTYSQLNLEGEMGIRYPAKEFCLCELLNKALKTIQPYAELERRPIEKGSRVLRKLASPVFGRPELAREVIENLLHNAVKYSLGGRPIVVNIIRSHSGWTLAVRNHGCRIGDDEREEIFRLEYRSRFTENVNVEGCGIGLWAARMLANHDKGSLRLSNCRHYDYIERDFGSPIERYEVEFEFWLPSRKI